MNHLQPRILTFVVLSAAAGCAMPVADPAGTGEPIAQSAEALTHTVQGRPDLKVYTTEPGSQQPVRSGGFFQCRGDEVLAGFDQESGSHAIACRTVPHYIFLTDPGGHPFPTSSTWNGLTTEQPLPLINGPNNVLRIGGGQVYVANGVDFTTGNLTGYLLGRSEFQQNELHRVDSNTFVNVPAFQTTLEIHVCSSSFPVIHGANVLVPSQQNPQQLTPFTFSCVAP